MAAAVKTSRQQIQNVLAQIREAIHEEGGPLPDSNDRTHPLFPENNGYRSSSNPSSSSSASSINGSSSVGSSTRASGASTTLDRPWANGSSGNRFDDPSSSLSSRSTSSISKIGSGPATTTSGGASDLPSSIRDSDERRRDLSLFPNDSVLGSSRREPTMYSSDGAAALRRARESSALPPSSRDDYLPPSSTDRMPPPRILSDTDIIGRPRDDFGTSSSSTGSALSSDLNMRGDNSYSSRPTSSLKASPLDSDRDTFSRDPPRRTPLDPITNNSSNNSNNPVSRLRDRDRDLPPSSTYDRYAPPPSPPGRSRAVTGINGSLDSIDNGYRSVPADDTRRPYGHSDLGGPRDYLRRPGDRSDSWNDRNGEPPTSLISRLNMQDPAGRSIDSAQPRSVNERDLREQHIRSIVRSQERERDWRRERDDDSPYDRSRGRSDGWSNNSRFADPRRLQDSNWGRRDGPPPNSRWNDDDENGWSDVGPLPPSAGWSDVGHYGPSEWDHGGPYRRGRIDDDRGRWPPESPHRHLNGRDDDEVVHTDVVGSPRRREQIAFIDVTPDGYYDEDAGQDEDEEGFVAASDEDLYAASIAFHSGFLKVAANAPPSDGGRPPPPFLPPPMLPPQMQGRGGAPPPYGYPNSNQPPYSNGAGPRMRGGRGGGGRGGRGGRGMDADIDDMGKDRPAGIATGMGQAMPAWFNQGMTATGDRGAVPLLAGKPHPMAPFMFNGQLTLQSFPPLDATPVPITDHIFLGDFHCSANRENLQRLGIRAIVNCTSEIACHFPDSFHYFRVNVDDLASTDIKQYFQQSINFIDTAKRHGDNVLVHCLAGRARSASIVICYLMARLGMSLRAAFEYVRQRKPDIRPNVGFWGQLIAFDIELFGRASMQLEQGQAVPT